MRGRLLLASILSASSCPAWSAPACDLASLHWMVGQWRHCEGTACTEERWLPPRDNRMLGLNQTWGGGDSFEFLRIESRDDQVVYLAQPQGADATAFTLTRCAIGDAHFENPINDFPQRIAYRTEGDSVIVVRIDDGQPVPQRSMQWRWSRVEPAEQGD